MSACFWPFCPDLAQCVKQLLTELFFPSFQQREAQWPLWLPHKQYGKGYAYFRRKNTKVHGRLINKLGGKLLFLILISDWLMLDNINTLGHRQNGRHFADDTFKCILLNETPGMKLFEFNWNFTEVCSLAHYDLCPVDSCVNLLSALDSRNGVMSMRTSPHLRALLINNNPCGQQFS